MLKRVLPFFAAFMLGIFITGLLGIRPFSFRRHDHGRFESYRAVRAERDQLRIENEALRNGQKTDSDDIEIEAPMPPPPPPPAPVAPARR